MALGDTAKLLASLELQDKFSKPADAATAKLGGLEKSFAKIGKAASKGLSSAVKNLEKLAVAGGVALIGAVGAGVKSLSELSQLEGQTQAVIESTGAKAGVTARQVRDLAQAYEDVSTLDDKVIQGGENMLLTFTNIGKDVFPDATKAMIDMAIAMNGGSVEGIDLKNTAIQIGKALNDPIKGVTALRKVGVALTADQEKQIKQFIKVGDVVSAQRIILKELETEFGKAGEAAGKDFGSDLRRLQDVGEDLSIALATGVLPLLSRTAKFLKERLADPAVMRAIKQFGDDLGEAGAKFFDMLGRVDWSKVKDTLSGIRDAGAGLVQAFLGLPDWAKNVLIGLYAGNKLTGGAVASIVGELGKGLIKGVLGMNAAVVNINAGVVKGPGGLVPGGPTLGGGGISLLGKGLLLGLAGELAVVVAAVNDKVTQDTNAQASDVRKTATDWLNQNPTMDQLISGYRATELGIAQLKGQFGGVADALNLGGTHDAIVAMQAQEQAFLDKIKELEFAKKTKGDPYETGPRSGGDYRPGTDAQWWKDHPFMTPGEQEAILRDNLTATRDVDSSIADLKYGLVSQQQQTENLLRANLYRPQPAPVVNVSVSTSVAVSDVWSTTMQTYYAGVRDKIR